MIPSDSYRTTFYAFVLRVGFGSELLTLLVQIGRKEGLRRITGHISRENTTMKIVSEQVGFRLRFNREADEWLAEIAL